MRLRASVAFLVLGLAALTACGGTPEPVDTTTSQPTQTAEPAPDAVPEAIAAVGASASATAPPSEDAAGNPVTYAASNVIDGDSRTAWRTVGDGLGLEIVLDLGTVVTLTEVGLIPGYAKVDGEIDRFHQNRRVLEVVWDFSDGTQVTQSFSDLAELQSIPVDAQTNWVRIRIVATSDHDGRDFTAISEVALVGYP